MASPDLSREASKGGLRMFDIEEMGPNMQMDQLVPHQAIGHPGASCGRGHCYWRPALVGSFCS